ncbi:MAG: mitochondrial splicing system protein, partial [Watsoniomyces obsoletus]
AQAYWTASLAITHRQSAYLRQCQTHLEDFLAQTQAHSGSHHTDNHEDLVGEVEPEIDIVTAAEHLRYAASSLAKITGKGEGGDVEDVLGVVFEK